MNSFAIHLLRSMGRVDAESGLTPARLSALSVIHFGGPLPLGRLAHAEGVSSPTMSRVVDGLCELGLAERQAHEVNGRLTLVAATAAGSRLMQRAADRRAEVIAEALAALPARRRDSLVHASVHLPTLVNAVRAAAGQP
jgi:DNA-binding MarR family transcriptional regulator